MMTLRERKKAATRRNLLAAAERLFEARGYDAVTVAEIADAADVSVKTLFVYFRSKEDLVLADTTLIDALVAALRERAPGTTPAAVTGAVLHAALAQNGSGSLGIEGYHRRIGGEETLRSRVLRLWADYEDTVAVVLAETAGRVEPNPTDRLDAMQVIAIVRSLTSPEVRTLAAAHADEAVVIGAWIDEAVARVAQPTNSATSTWA
jgi:AcrR family transcriptional regulator